MKKILAVCLGNICRSPTAHGLLEAIAEQRGIPVQVDSAGTAAYHIGEGPDRRSQATMAAHGYDISAQRARQFIAADFDAYDVILAMDKSNYANIISLTNDQAQVDKVRLMLSFGEHELDEVPDPYYGGESGFEDVYAMIHKAVNAMYDQQ